jgi:hypothetical protein
MSLSFKLKDCLVLECIDMEFGESDDDNQARKCSKSRANLFSSKYARSVPYFYLCGVSAGFKLEGRI